MNHDSRRWILIAIAIVVVGAAVALGIASTVGSSDDSAAPIPQSGTIGALRAVKPTDEEQKLAEQVGIPESSLASAREVFTSAEAGRMVFFPQSQGGCLLMFHGTSCGDPNDKTLPVLSLMTSIESSPFLVGGGIARSDVAAVIYRDPAGREIRIPVVDGVLKVETSDRLTRDARYVNWESR